MAEAAGRTRHAGSWPVMLARGVLCVCICYVRSFTCVKAGGASVVLPQLWSDNLAIV